MKCPFGIGYELSCDFEGDKEQMIQHLIEESKERLARKIIEMVSAAGETDMIPKSAIREKISEVEEYEDDTKWTNDQVIQLIEELLE